MAWSAAELVCPLRPMAQTSPQFQTTLWTEVLLAGRQPDTTAGQEALARLCAVYWYPVYAFVRRRGTPVEDAQDLTQGFFAHILRSGFFGRADPEQGRFRNFLLGALRNYLATEAARRNTQRQGGGKERISIDAGQAERWLAAEASPENDATRAFDRAWANTLLAQALEALEREQAEAGRGRLFAALKDFLQRPAAAGEYDALAGELGMSKGAIAAAAHRLNRRFGDLVRKSVRDTVASPEMAEAELKFLFAGVGD